MFRVRNLLYVFCVAACSFCLCNAQEPFTYTYDNIGELGAIAGFDSGGTVNGGLNNNIGFTDYVPSTFLWEPGEQGTIFLEQSGTSVSQPRITLSLTNGFVGLTNVVIYYFERTGSGITAPESITSTVGGEVRTITSAVGEIDNTPGNGSTGFGEIRAAGFNLSGLSGSSIQLDFINTLPAPGDWTGLTEIVVNDPTFSFPALPLQVVVNRNSGEIVLKNINSVPVDLKGYSITSAAGGLAPVHWMSIADNYDMDSQTGTIVDANGNWTNLTNPTGQHSQDLSEYQFGGDGGQIAANSSVSIGDGAWLQSMFEDLLFEYVDPATSEVVSGSVFYEGNDDLPFVRSDLNFDGEVDEDDWPIYAAGLSSDLSGRSLALAYQAGDLDGDLDNDLKDYVLFRSDFDAAQGAGTFAAMIAVPEPSSFALSAALVGAIIAMRRRSGTRVTFAGRLAIVAFLVSFAASSTLADRPFTYSYDNAAELEGVAGFDTDGAGALQNNGGLNDSTGLVGYVPGAFLWEPGEVGTIYRHDGLESNPPQPRITLNLTQGSVPLSNVTIYHFERTSSAVSAPEEIIATIGGDVRTITAAAGQIDDEAGNGSQGPGFGVVRAAAIDLSGITGDSIQLDFINSAPQILGAFGQWTGISEIVIDEAILRARVNTATGNVTLYNPLADAVEIDGYQLLSAGGSLNTAGWNSLDDQNYDSIGSGIGQSWDEGGGSNANDISEAFLLGMSGFADEGVSLGQAYDTTIDAQDILLRYTTTDGHFYGLVDYVSSGIPGDHNGDGSVDAADYVHWRDKDGMSAGYQAWRANFGATGGSGASSGSGAAVPEPTGLMLVLLGMTAVLGRQWYLQRGLRSTRAMRGPFLAILIFAAMSGTPNESLAAFGLDRDYLLGDNGDEFADENDLVGLGAGGFTFDSEGTPFAGDFQDLERIDVAGNDPVYVSVSDRPGAGSTLGVAFDGSGDYLQGDRLGLPSTSEPAIPGDDNLSPLAQQLAAISNRGFQFWAKPASAGQGTPQALLLDTNQHGALISSSNTWVMRYAGIDTDSGVEVDFDNWSHVMVVRPSGAAGGARMYVDGVAVAALLGGFDGADDAPLVLGANTGDVGMGQTAPGTQDFYFGVLDDLSMFVFGTSTGGTVHGEFNFITDNGFAAAEFTGVDGDVDQNGLLELADISAFVDGWLFDNLVNGVRVADLNSLSQGDLNFDGITNLHDAILLDGALQASGMGSMLAFDDLGNPYAIPEPPAWGSAIVAALAFAGGRYRSRRRRPRGCRI